MKSMTAYGRAKVETSSGILILEIHSVNRKGFDMYFHVPKEFLCFDMEMRKRVAKQIKRGQVTLRITKEFSANNTRGLLPSIDVLLDLKKSWTDMAAKLDLPSEEINLRFLTEQLQRFPAFDAEAKDPKFLENLLKGVDEALNEVMDMKRKEGTHLTQDILPRLEQIQALVEEIQKQSEKMPDILREKLTQRIKELVDLSEAEERIHKEVILYAEKSDITEEITRLFSHIKQFNEYLNVKQEAIGRTLDFLLQEMHREVNTISSKSADLDISKTALSMKSEIEKIKEQVQNIE